MRAEGFFCSLDVFYGGLGIGKSQFLIQKYLFSVVNLFNFGSSKPWIRIGIHPKMLDPDLESMNSDPKHYGTCELVGYCDEAQKSLASKDITKINT